MKGESGFQERVNWKDVEKENPPQKGFGNIRNALKLKEKSRDNNQGIKNIDLSLGFIDDTLKSFGITETGIKEDERFNKADTKTEDKALTLLSKKFRNNFAGLDKYKSLSGQWNADDIVFEKLPRREYGFYSNPERKIGIDNSFKGSVFQELIEIKENQKELEKYNLRFMYVNLHEHIHSLYPLDMGEIEKLSNRDKLKISVVEESITATLSREWLKDFVGSNSLKMNNEFNKRMLDDESFTDPHGYRENYFAIKEIIGFFFDSTPSNKGVADYCLKIKKADFSKRIELIKSDYRNKIIERMGEDKFREKKNEVENILRRFDEPDLYSKPKNVRILKEDINTLLEGNQNDKLGNP